MKCNRLNKYGSVLASAMAVLVSALAADAQPLIPIDQRRNIDTFAFLPQCGQQGSDQDQAVGFAPFNGRRCELKLPGSVKLEAEIRVREMVEGKPGAKTEIVKGLGRGIPAGTDVLRIEWNDATPALKRAIRRLRAR